MPRTKKPIWPNIEAAFGWQYPEIDEVRIERLDPRCRPWDFDQMLAFCDDLVARYDDGKPTIMVGHSGGGIFALRVAEQFEHTYVLGIVTICTPHRLLRDLYPRKLKVRNDIRTPIISVGGMIDGIVPVWATRHPRARMHKTFFATHRRTFARRPYISHHIARIAKKEFARPHRPPTSQ
ncbi:alpha/beta fold hydrolase [Candidatus Kaiserbacteria bacterium]|nr:alpha/beta fold hydrolase [Candidatus Kaiserbacteria bacterium]